MDILRVKIWRVAVVDAAEEEEEDIRRRPTKVAILGGIISIDSIEYLYYSTEE